MPSHSRRRLLAATATVGLAGMAGCSALGRSRPERSHVTGLAQDTSQALNDEVLYVGEDASELPNPPVTTDSLEEADAVLATATADLTKLARAFRAGKPVAIAGDGATSAVQRLLNGVQEEYSFGVEEVRYSFDGGELRERPAGLVVAEPRGDTVETYTFVADGGWDDPILDPLGWAFVGRVPECDTAVPESSSDDMFEYAGAAHIVGRLPTGESYVSRSEASVSQQDAGLFLRLRTKLHAAANDGYPVDRAVWSAGFANDKRFTEVYPNAHTQNGVQVANMTNTTRKLFAFEATPTNSRGRAALTGCGGLQTEGGLAYSYESGFEWEGSRFFTTDRQYGGAKGHGEWSFNI